MLGRARVKRICQAALGALIDPKKATYDLVKDETGELFDRWFPDKSTPQQRLLKAVLRDVSKAYPDQALSELLTKKAQALLAMHGLSREELAGPGVKLDAQRAVERVCARGLKIMQPGLHEANRSFDGRLPPIEIEASIEQPLRQLVWSFYDSLIKNFDEELQVAIFGRTLDLLEGIDRKLDSLTRPAEGPAPPFSIPQPVGDFKGYEDEIAAVQAALAEGSALISAVQGIGGVGKTELAREVARRMRGDFPDGQILVDMLGTTQPREARDAMTDVLVALGAEDVRPATLAAEYHSRLAGKRVLILLDNVASGAGLQELVPPPPAALLVTSRTRFAMAGVVPVELEKLSREAAKALLGGIVPGLDDPVLDALAGLCADLPLALRVAGAYLQETGYPVDAYIAELKERRLARLARSATATEDARLDPEVVLGHSYDRLVEADAGLARAFTLLGVFPADFELAGAAAVLGMEPDAARERLTLLRRRSLVQQPEGGARWRLHDLLRELAVKPAEPGEHEDAAARHRSYYLALLTWCANEFNNVRVDVNRALATFEAEQPNVTAAIDHAIACKDLQPAALARLATDILDTAIGRREEALQAIQDAVDLYRRLAHDRPGDFNHSLALSLNNLGTSLNALGRREDALSATEEAVAIRRRLARDRPDAFNPELAASVDNLGIMLNALGRREDALRATEEAVGLYRRLARDRPDAFNPDLATSVDNLGNMLNALGRREDALGATEEAVAIRRRLARDRPDAFNPVLATLLYNLSLRLDALDRFDEAQTRNIEAIEALRPTFLRHPQAVIHWMGPMCQQYIERCQKLGVEPDAALLGPIVEVFERLKSEAG